MKCAWKSYINLLPIRLRTQVDKIGCEKMLELRLRCGQKPEIVSTEGISWLDTLITREDLRFTVNVASEYSAWSCATAAYGYITAEGGHRIGLCGQAVVNQGRMTGIREPTSLCLRVAKDITGIAERAKSLQGSILIIGRPGCGKTTLLRDLIRQKSQKSHVTVVDSRQEIFPVASNLFCFDIGMQTDVISGCSKVDGIDAALRCMNPDYIAVDEITATADCTSLLNAGWCGVSLLATAHAGDKFDLMRRPVYKPLLEHGLFDYLIVLKPDRTWCVGRMKV